MHATNLVKGSRYVQTVYLVQDQPNQDLPIKAVFDIPQSIRSWISVNPGETFSIPKGVRQFPVEIVIDVPKDTTLGDYHGTVTFVSNPSAEGQVVIALAVQVDMSIKVGTDIYRKFAVPLIRPLDIEEGWDPRIYVKFNNEGNVPEAFDGAIFELFDQFGGARLAYAQRRGQNEFPQIPPFTIQEFTVEFPVDFHLGIGQYWASVVFYQNEKAVASQRTVFNVLKRGSLSTPLQRFINSVKDYWPYYAGGVVVAVFVIGLSFGRRRSRRSE
jgi:hypothetical protein